MCISTSDVKGEKMVLSTKYAYKCISILYKIVHKYCIIVVDRPIQQPFSLNLLFMISEFKLYMVTFFITGNENVI